MRKTAATLAIGLIVILTNTACLQSWEEQCADDGGTLQNYTEPDGEVETWCVDANGKGLWEAEYDD